MIEPDGPLPQSVYWRRRVLAAVASMLAVALLAWLIGGLVEADDQHPVQGTGGGADLDGAADTVRVTSDRPSTPPSSPGPDDPRGSVTASPSSSAPTSAAPPATTPPVATPAPPPAPCPDAVMKVVAGPDVPSYPVGARPRLELRIVNAGPVPCIRDVNGRLREILVLGADGTRLWSSNDCYGPPEQDVRVLAPNQPAAFPVNWAGRTSEPGCPVNRRTVPAGTYRVVGKLGPLTGAPTPLTMT